MLIYLAKENKTVFIDFREKAPRSATRDLFLTQDGQVDTQKARFSTQAAGVPGTVSGLELARKQYGTQSFRKLVKPAYQLAHDGIPITSDLYDSLLQAGPQLLKDPDASKIFYQSNGTVKPIGSLLKQKQLAQTLKTLIQFGPDSFYTGKIADKLVRYMTQTNGLITHDDLRAYQAKERAPLSSNYKGYTIYTAPPPSSGGLLLAQLLYQLSFYPLAEWGHNSAQTIHMMTELMKLSYADRAKWLGDPDFVSIPTQDLVSAYYLDKRRPLISETKATPSKVILAGDKEKFAHEFNDTTHFSVVDKDGNAVTVTYTLNFSYGSRRMIPGTGLFLNNEMDDFVAKAGEPNAYGLVGSDYNQIEPEKRMLSSMSPTIITKDNQFFMATGSPGGSRIITTTLQMILNVIEFDMTIAEATYAPRFHHQWLPDVLFIERGFSKDTLTLLESKGHTLRVSRGMGSTHSILLKDNRFYGSSDPRKPGALTLGY